MKVTTLTRFSSEPTISKKKKSLLSQKKSVIQKEYPYYPLIKSILQDYQNLIDPKILHLVKQMLKPIPSNRITCTKLVQSLKKLQEEFEKKELIQTPLKSSKSTEDFQSDDITLSSCLKNPYQRKYFKLFLKKERADENVIFIEEVEKMKSLSSMELRIKKAYEITATFMDRCSGMEINISEQLIRDVINHINLGEKYRSLPIDVFDIVVEDIKLILQDPWKRFMDSDLKEEMTSKYKRRSLSTLWSVK
jgi:hypothetical protein